LNLSVQVLVCKAADLYLNLTGNCARNLAADKRNSTAPMLAIT